MQKKAISPVVATALLLVVAVVAVVGFQSWFTTYQSGVNVKVEQESKSGSAITIERLEVAANGVIYVKNNGVDDINITSWKVSLEGVLQCAGTDVAGYNAVAESVSSFTGTAACAVVLESGKAYDVVAISQKGVSSATAIAR